MEQLVKLTFLKLLKEEQPEKFRKLINQLEKANSMFMDRMKSYSEPERDFMRMFKMQVDMMQEDFLRLEMKFKLRFLCFFFCNFVDKIIVQFYFGDFWQDIKIYQEFKTVQTK